jgi:hypothetical protein
MKPWQVLIFVAAVIAVLGTLYQVIPDGKIWSTDRFADDIQVTETDTIAEFPVYAAETDSIVPEEPKIIVPKVVVDSTTDSRIFLASFYASLAQTGERKVRVLHYGDSQIEEDRISQQIREKLQARFGGKGVGLMPLAQTIPTLTVKQELRMNGRFVMPQQGPRRYLVYSFKRDQRADGLYGPMGQMAEMNDSLVEGSEVITAICKPIVSTALYERWQVFADTSVHYSFSGDTVQLNGRGKVYGLSQESRTGVIVDNITMRG